MIEVRMSFLDCDVRKLQTALEEALSKDKNLALRIQGMAIDDAGMSTTTIEYKCGLRIRDEVPSEGQA